MMVRRAFSARARSRASSSARAADGEGSMATRMLRNTLRSDGPVERADRLADEQLAELAEAAASIGVVGLPLRSRLPRAVEIAPGDAVELRIGHQPGGCQHALLEWAGRAAPRRKHDLGG